MQDGKSNYLEGAMLLGMYIIIALAFVSAQYFYRIIRLMGCQYVYPDSTTNSLGPELLSSLNP